MTYFLKKIIKLNRVIKQIIMISLDSIIIVFCLLLAFSLRLGYFWVPSQSIIASEVIFTAPLIAILVFYSFGLYKSIIRYIGFKGLWSIAKAVTLYLLFWVLVSYLVFFSQGIPRSVILINWMLCIIFLGGYRLFAYWIFFEHSKTSSNDKKNIIIYGAGSSGIQLSQSLRHSNEYNQVAYIDDNILLQSTYINGIEVFLFKKISSLVNKYDVREIFLAMPSISKIERKKIITSLESLSIVVKSLPSINEIAEGKIRVDDLREVSVKDLLGREIVKPNQQLLKINITDKVILVTGAGGSIGSELCRQIFFLKPKKLIIFDISESSLYQIDQELTSFNIKKIQVIPVLGSVRDIIRMEDIFITYKVETIYHAAAYKHVPLVEYNQSEGVLNNVFGTLTAAEAAINSKVETFVLISTDKAVRPTNTMGATKRASELVLQALNKKSHDTCFTMVRFGNVLDSSGSVIPLFKKQIKNGGPVTVTDKDITRYFMTIPEAVELVIQAGALGTGGDVFVLDMGSPVRINDLAIKLIHLSGLQLRDSNNQDGDIEIAYTGLRPGEKLYEELLVGKNVKKTENKLIMRAIESMIEWELLEPLLLDLREACINRNQEKIRQILIKIVPEFTPQSPVLDPINGKQ